MLMHEREEHLTLVMALGQGKARFGGAKQPGFGAGVWTETGA